MQAIVYKAVNTTNGHWYVGFTTRGLRERERQHRHGRGNTSILRRAIDKYGQEAFTFEVLYDFQGDEELAKLYEREMIAKYCPEYNLNYGGDGGSTHPDTRAKISAANKGKTPVFKGRKWTEEARLRMKEAKAGKPGPWAGKKRSAETVEKMRAAATGKPSAMKGKTYSQEIRERMSAAARTRKPRDYTEEDKNRIRSVAHLGHAKIRKQVRCLLDGQIFPSAAAASRHYGMRDRTVSRLITGDLPPRKDGLCFEYVKTEANDVGQ